MNPVERLWVTHRPAKSQRERVVLFLLAAEDWRSIADIHRYVGFCRLNSRVAEARKVFKRDGHPFDIVHSIRDAEHGYELVPLAEGEHRPVLSAQGTDDDGMATGAVTPQPSPSASGSNLSSQADPNSHGEDGPLVVPPRPTPDEYASLPVLPPEILEGQGQLL